MSIKVLRTIGTNVRWLGPVTGPNAFNWSTLQVTGVDESTSPSPAIVKFDGSVWERASRLFRSRIGHLLTEEHQPALRVIESASHPGFGDSNASLHHLAPLAIATLFQNSHALIAIELKTILGKTTAHLLLINLTECQARRMRGLDVLDDTLLFGAESRARAERCGPGG